MTRYFRRLILGVLTLGTALVWAEDTPAVGIEGIVICVGSSGYVKNEYGTFSPEMLFDGEATTGWLEPNQFNANKEYFVWAELSVPYCPQTMVLTALPGWAEGRRPSKVAVSGRGLDGTTTELGVFNLAWQAGAATVELAASGYYTNLKIRFLERVGGTTTDTSRAFGLGEISFEGQRLPGSPSVPTAGDLVAADRPSGFSTTTCTTLGQKASALFDGITKFDNTAAAAADQHRWIVNFNDSTINQIYFTVTLAKDDDDGEVGRLCGYELHMQVASSASPYDYEKRLPTKWDLYVSSKKSPTADDWTLVESRSGLTISSYNFDSANLHYSIGFDLDSPVAVRSVKFVFEKGKSTKPTDGYLQLSEVVLNGYRTDGEADTGSSTKTTCFATDHSLKASVTVKPLAVGVTAYDLYAICRGAGTAQTNVLATGATAAGSFACTFDELTPKTVYAIETRLVPAGETLETVVGEIIYAETREHYLTVPFPLARQDLSALSGDTARPQLHLTAPKGWINDPNGLSYYGGEWHVFCQHNPEDTTESWNKGRTCWQHFVSTDLAHWQPVGDAIRYYPQGTLPGARTDGVNGGAAIAASGSAITDFNGDAGFGENVHVLAYTALSGPGGASTRLGQQCLAWSPDGRSYFNLANNPIMGPRDPSGSYRADRDPKLVRYDDHWAMALYTEYAAHRNYEIFTSTNLKEWTPASRIDLGKHPGSVQAGWLIECPGLEKVKIEGEEGYAWVIWGGQATQCQVGEFDGVTFTPYGEEKQSTWVRQSDGSSPFYAAQAFADEPNGRTLWIPWFKTSSSSVYSQSLGLPEVLTLERTEPGQNKFRMLRRPAPELQLLRKDAGLDLAEGTKSFSNPLAEVELACDVTASSVVTFNLHGLSGTYTHATQKLTLNGSTYDWPIKDNRFSLTAYLDRGSAEIYSQDGRGGVIPLAGWNKSSDAFSCSATNASGADFKVYELSSIWDWTPEEPTTAEFARQVLSGELTAATLEADGELHRPDFGAELPVDIDYGASDWTSAGVHTATLTPADGVKWNNGTDAPKTFTLTITTPYHVTPEATGGGDGFSWETAMTFTEAMAAVGNGGVVWLKSGTYSVSAAVSLAGDVSILGGFAGTEMKLEDREPGGVSVLDAGGNNSIFSSVSPAAGKTFRLERVTLYRAKNYAIKKMTAGAVVLKECRLLNCRFPGKSGITVDRDNGTVSNSGSWSSGWDVDRATGAILVANGSATFEDCSFEGCAPYEVSYASSTAVALAKVSPAVFTRCQFLTNFIETTASTGQGVALFTAWSKPTLAECEFRANRSLSERASTVSLFESGDTVVRNCLFVGNDATGSAANEKGRGILVFWANHEYNQRLIENCTFAYNKGSSLQAALVFTEGREITVRNCIFWKNIRGVPSATNKGADIFADGASHLTMKVKVEYCLFQGSGNDYYWYDNGGASGSGLTVANTCLTGDPCFVTPTAEFETLFNVTPDASPMTAATWPGYAAAMTLDCHLAEGSPAIDAGDPTSDYSREPNPNDAGIDLGAYGNTEEAANYLTRPQVPADDIEDELAKLIITGRVNSCRFIADTLPHKPVFPASELYDVAYSEGDWTAVGSYTVTLTLKTDDYTWADGTTGPRVFTVEVASDPSELPPGVVRIPYVQGDGQTGYMLTGYHPNPTKDVLAAEVEFPNSVNEFKDHRTIWNTRIENSQSAYTLHEVYTGVNGLENIYNSDQRNNNDTRIKLAANTHYTFTGRKNTATVSAPGANEQTITAGSYSANFTATEMPLTLFAGRLGTAGIYDNFSNMRLYSFTVTDSTTGEVIHNYVPVYDTNTGKAGVYDIGTRHDEQAALYGNFSYTLFDIAPIASVYYTGAAVMPALVITNFLTGAEIEDPTEFFDITYNNNVNPGTATVTITPKQGTVFAGVPAVTRTFAILTRYYVTPEATGTGDGLSWATAFTIDQALAAMTTGGEAWIKEGNYTLSASPSVKSLSSEYVLHGGFAGSETTLEERASAAVSTISGGGSKSFLQLNTSGAGVTLERLVLTDFADAVLRRAGTGTVTLKKCRVLNAHYSNYGYNKRNVGNSFSTYSTAMDTVVGAVLLDRGTAVFEDCSFEGVSPSVDPKSNGGAVGLVNLTSATFTRCHFLTNSVMLGVGMGICLTAYASPVSFEGCTFRGNRGKAQRSCAIALITPGDSSFKNCLFTGNDVSGTASGSDYGGRGLIQWWGSPVNENVRLDIDLCTFAYNIGSAHQAVVAAQTGRVAVRNSIFYLNLRGATGVRSKGSDIYVDSQKGSVNSYSTVTVDYSFFEGTGDDWCWRSTQGTAGALTLTNIVTGDPLFQTTAAEFKELFGVGAGTSPYLTATWPGFEAAMTLDCHLTKHSTAVDAGDPAAEYANEPQPNGKRVNLGAYGNTSEARKTKRKATVIYLK